MRTIRPFLLAILIAAALPAHAAQDYVDIEKRLTPEQIKATGLDRLSGPQLELLNTLLRDDQRAAVETAVEASRDESERRVLGTWFGSKGVEPIASTARGEMRGWSRGTVFTLENGQRWRVVEGDYYAGKPFTDPKVLITPGKISGWYLKVEGHNPQAKVQRID